MARRVVARQSEKKAYPLESNANQSDWDRTIELEPNEKDGNAFRPSVNVRLPDSLGSGRQNREVRHH